MKNIHSLEFPGGLVVKELVSLLWFRLLLMAWVQSLAWEFLHAVGMTKKKKKWYSTICVSFIHQKIIWNVQCASPWLMVPVYRYSHLHTLSCLILPLQGYIHAVPAIVDFSLKQGATEQKSTIAPSSQASDFNFALRLPRQRLLMNSQFPSLLGTFHFSSILPVTSFDHLKLVRWLQFMGRPGP